jgi:hypothetical protein
MYKIQAASSIVIIFTDSNTDWLYESKLDGTYFDAIQFSLLS